MTEFKRYIKHFSTPPVELPPPLPLTHVTNCTAFEEILGQGHLSPRNCGFFNKMLIYCFYGRASYRLEGREKNEGATAQSVAYPACILLNGEQLPDRVGQSPFDTGAFLTGRFKEHLSPFGKKVDLELLDLFALDVSPDCLRRCVRAFFGTNDRYYDISPLDSLSPASPSGTVSNYHELLKTRRSTRFDDRAMTFEVRFGNKIPLNKNTVLKIVIPRAWMNEERKYFSDLFKGLELSDVVTSYRDGFADPLEHFGALRQKVAGIMEGMKLLST
ncbi:MAG: hypothetical protein HQL76_00055 [Magnetococcales bacterium]|nr:hypothetical protein [Magnetococcales bacterium]